MDMKLIFKEMIQKAIFRLENLLETFPKQLEAINDIDFKHKHHPEKWSKQEILGHLIDSATTNHQRFIRVQMENSPGIWYDQNRWVESCAYQNMDRTDLTQLWISFNRYLVHIIKNITPENVLRTCKMKDGSEHSLQFLIQDYLNHLEHHVQQILDSKN